jgi:hypothetical protein
MTGFCLTISEGGIEDSFRLFCAEGDQAKGVSCQGSFLNLNYGTGGSLRLSTSSTGTNTHWTYFSLLGKTLSWDVDLSNVPCGLNATFYSVFLHDGNSYRDACATFPSTTELDFMEANRYAWHTTLHRGSNDCGSAPPIGIGGTIGDPRYQFQDRNGIQKNASQLYGPGELFCINTLIPFHASISFEISSSSSTLTSVVIILSQGAQSIGQTYDASNEEYKGWLLDLGQEIGAVTSTSGNVLVWSLWTGGLNWLESPPCGRNSHPSCDANSCQYTLSNISIS